MCMVKEAPFDKIAGQRFISALFDVLYLENDNTQTQKRRCNPLFMQKAKYADEIKELYGGE